MNSSFLFENRMPKRANYSKFELENRQEIGYNKGTKFSFLTTEE